MSVLSSTTRAALSGARWSGAWRGGLPRSWPIAAAAATRFDWAVKRFLFVGLLVACSGSQRDTPVGGSRTSGPAPSASPLTEERAGEARSHEPSAPTEAARHRTACESGDFVACHAAALNDYHSPPSPDADRRAFEYFERACRGGYAPSCNGLGVMYATGRGVAQDEAEAVRIYHQACLDGASTACTHLEQALRYGRGVAKDGAAAEAAAVRGKCVFEKSLRHEPPTGCPGLDAVEGGEGAVGPGEHEPP